MQQQQRVRNMVLLFAVVLMAVMSGTATIQAQITKLNLGTQGQNVDFSAAAYTVPAAVGSTLPTTCVVGQMFFKNTAPAGSNLYTCSAPNAWTQLIPSQVQTVSGMSPVNGNVALSSTNLSDATSLLRLNTTASQALGGPLTGPRINNVFHVEGFPTTCTVNGINYGTQLDCAFYSLIANGTTSATLELGSNSYSAPYDTCAGLVEPATGLQVQLRGQTPGDNISPTEIRAVCPMQAVISHPDIAATSSTPYSLNISNINIDGNGKAQQCLAIFAEKVGTTEHVHCRGAIGTGAWVQFGDNSPASGYRGDGYQYHLKDIFVMSNGSSQSNWASVTVTQSGGIPSFTVGSAGSYVYPNPPAYLFGWGAGANPCTTMGTLSVTTSGSGPYTVTGVTGSGFAGCSGTLYVYVPDLPAAQYGILIDYLTDSTFEDLVVANVGRTAGIQYTHGSNRIISEHPYGGMPVLVWDKAANTHLGSELDTPIHFGAESDSARALWADTEFTWNTSDGSPNSGSSGFYAPSGLNLMGSTCASGTINSSGFNLVVSGSGPIGHGNGTPYSGSYTILNAMQCDNLSNVNWIPYTSTYSLNINQDNGNNPTITVGTGSATANFVGVSGSRAKFGFSGTNAVVQATNGIEFDTASTFASGKIAGWTAAGISYASIGSAIASAGTITPTSPVVHVTGTAVISTMTAPTGCSSSGYGCSVTLIPDGGWTITTGGNFASASSAVVGRPLTCLYDPATAKWYGSY